MTDDWLSVIQSPPYTWDFRAPPATAAEIVGLAAAIGRPLPDDYIAFLRLAGEAVLGYADEWVLSFWRPSNIPSWSSAYGFEKWMPGAICFGSNMGGEGLVFDIRGQHPNGNYPIVVVNYVSLDWEDAICVSSSFTELLLRHTPLL